MVSGKSSKSASHTKGRQLDPQALDVVRRLLGDAPRCKDLLIEFLHLIQDEYGHLSAAHLVALASELKLSQTEVYEVASFYAHFDVVKEGEKPPPPLTVRVCNGIACEMAGARDLLNSLQAALGDSIRVQPVPCIGACETAPAVAVGGNRLGHANTAIVQEAITGSRTETQPVSYQGYDAYRKDGGYAALEACLSGDKKAEDILEQLETSGLRGLGGAGFPVARKWRFLLDNPKPRIVALNADEGEPGTFKDRHCLETTPHKVLEGTLIAAWSVEAEDIYIYLRDEYPHIRAILKTEIALLEKAGLTQGVTIHLRRGAGAYVCGEETALLESLEGKRGLPRNRPPFPANEGLFGRPTLINNVETLYFVTEIISKGAEPYLEAGRPHFYSVSGRVRDPGVKLAPAGTTVNTLIEDHAGGMAEGHVFAGYLPGGASGGMLPADKGDVPLDFGSLEQYGCFVGSSAVVILSDKDNIKTVVRNLTHFFEEESCGQCTPCRAGCDKLSQMFAAGDWDAGLIGELAEAMGDASICGLGQAAANPVISALKFFKGDLK
ncbi:MAG: NAD(P)H-dependent oxidoreductase subunit E [Rhodospirillaceae bacterium]|nr:NAD(P)H-dependent oxidoreductase subunit E [Rhodospirillaceae bacterium]